MKKLYKAISILFFLIPSITGAVVYSTVNVEQTNGGILGNLGDYYSSGAIQELGTGIFGRLSEVDLYITKPVVTYGSALYVKIYERATSSIPTSNPLQGAREVWTGTPTVAMNSLGALSGALSQLTSASSTQNAFNFDSSKYYYLMVDEAPTCGCGSQDTIQLSGVATSTSYDYGNAYYNTTGTTYANYITLRDFKFKAVGLTRLAVFNDSTRIIDFTPNDGDSIGSATTTGYVTVNFTLQAYINSGDVGNYMPIKITLHNLDQNLVLFSNFSPDDIYFLDGFIATSSGYFNYATSTAIHNGNYMLEASLEHTFLSGLLINPFANNEYYQHQYTVGASTYVGKLNQTLVNDVNNYLGLQGATTTVAKAQTCNPFGNFDTILCMTFLFKPDSKSNDDLVKLFSEAVAVRVPWGYISRTYNIFKTTATSSLPAFTVHVPTGAGSSSTPVYTALTFDMSDMIVGGGKLLESVHDPINNKSPKDIFSPLVALFLGMGLITTIWVDLTGSHQHNASNGGKTTKLS